MRGQPTPVSPPPGGPEAPPREPPEVIRERRRRAQRARDRRIVWASVGIAVLAHAAFFALAPHFRFSVASDPHFGEAAVRSLVLGGIEVDLHFGPPAIRLPDGTFRSEPGERFLDREGITLGSLQVELTCADAFPPGAEPREGAVRLRVGITGHASGVELERSSGDACADAAIVAAANALWYRWLPNLNHHAPVDLVQPVRLDGVRAVD
jgi:hypothetical protein